MPERDATLDAFISSTTDEESEAEDERDDAGDGDGATVDDQPGAEMGAESESTDSGSATSNSERVSESAVTTMAWSPEGEACEACGTSAMRRWRTDSGFCCSSCVDWERTPNH